MFENIPWLNGLLVFLIGMLVVFFGIAIIVLKVEEVNLILGKVKTKLKIR
jgi:hypothetical protein